MMNFYESLSEYYDDLFPASAEAVDFLAKRCPPSGTVLDLACGTGGHAIELSERGSRVSGVDLDASMVRKADEKCSREDVEFFEGNMLEIRKLFPDAGVFDLVYCIGNSLVHLDSAENILHVLENAFSLLKDKGRLVIQLLNFDGLSKGGSINFPVIRAESRGLSMIRSYTPLPDGAHVRFDSELVPDGGGDTVRSGITLRVLPSEELVHLCEKAGFRMIALYGDFKEGPFSPRSFALVLTGEKPPD